MGNTKTMPPGSDAGEVATFEVLAEIKTCTAAILACIQAIKGDVSAIAASVAQAVALLASINTNVISLSASLSADISVLQSLLVDIDGNLVAIRILLGQVLTAINAMALDINQILGILEGGTIVLGDMLALLEAILAALDKANGVQWHVATGRDCDTDVVVRWVEGLDCEGNLVFPGGACPIYQPGKLDASPILNGRCIGLAKALFFPGGEAVAATVTGAGTAVHTLTIPNTGQGVGIRNQIDQNIANPTSTFCSVRIEEGVEFVFSPANTTLAGDTYTSNEPDVLAGCEDRYAEWWDDRHADGVGATESVNLACATFVWQEAGPPTAADCRAPLDPQPVAVEACCGA